MENNIENIEQESKLDIYYSIDLEVKRIKSTLERLPWYEENKYNWKSFKFPEGLDSSEVFTNKKVFTDGEIEELITKEFCTDKYLETKNYLLEEWKNIVSELKTLLENCNLSIQSEYQIVLTKYGTGGSYNLPNFVFLNTGSIDKDNHRVFITLIHEMIHLSIENLIREFELTQWQKERMVDLILANFFPDFKRMQKNPLPETQLAKIDSIFETNYPDIKVIVEKIKGLKS